MDDDQIVPELVYKETQNLPSSLPTVLNTQHVKSDNSLELCPQNRGDNPSRSKSCDDNVEGRKRSSSGDSKRRLQKQDTLDDEVFSVILRPTSQTTVRERRDTYRKSSGYGTQESKETPQSSVEINPITAVQSLPQVSQESTISGEQMPFDWILQEQDNLPFLSVLLFSGERPFSLATESVAADQLRDIPENLPCISMLQTNLLSNDEGNLQSNDDSFELNSQDIANFLEKEQHVNQNPPPNNIVDRMTFQALDENPNLSTHQMPRPQAPLEPSNTVNDLKKMFIENYLESKNLEIQDPTALQTLMRELLSDTSTPNQSPFDALGGPSQVQSGQSRAHKSPSKSPDSPLASFGFDCDEANAKKIKLSEPDSRQSVIISRIFRASRCNQKACLDDECKKGQDYLKCVDDSLKKGVNAVNSRCKEIIFCLIEHRKQCREFCCSSIWCHKLQGLQYEQCLDDPSAIMGFMCSIIQGPLLQFSDNIDYKRSLFTKLSPKCQYDNTVTEGMDWIPLAALGTYGDVVIAADTRDGSYSIIKKMKALAFDQHIKVYKQLKLVSHAGIVDHLWLLEYGQTNYVCSEFESGGSLYQILQNDGKLSVSAALKFIKPLVHAAMFLHEMGILYMAWSSDNVVLNKKTAKLSNFSMAIPLGKDFDEDGTKSSLPPHLLPPEPLRPQNLSALTDTWGVGCLCAELTTGTAVHCDWVHDSKETIWEKLAMNPIPSIPENVDGIIQDLCTVCWKIIPAERPSMEMLYQILSCQ